MKALLQRVTDAHVQVDGVRVAQISTGLLVLLGIETNDTPDVARKMVEKIVNTRLFSNDEGRFDRSLVDIRGDLLMVSQFTLMADCRKGRRPNFLGAQAPQLAQIMFDQVVGMAKDWPIGRVETGVFGASMSVTLTNDGPVTIWLDSNTLFNTI